MSFQWYAFGTIMEECKRSGSTALKELPDGSIVIRLREAANVASTALLAGGAGVDLSGRSWGDGDALIINALTLLDKSARAESGVNEEKVERKLRKADPRKVLSASNLSLRLRARSFTVPMASIVEAGRPSSALRSDAVLPNALAVPSYSSGPRRSLRSGSVSSAATAQFVDLDDLLLFIVEEWMRSRVSRASFYTEWAMSPAFSSVDRALYSTAGAVSYTVPFNITEADLRTPHGETCLLVSTVCLVLLCHVLSTFPSYFFLIVYFASILNHKSQPCQRRISTGTKSHCSLFFRARHGASGSGEGSAKEWRSLASSRVVNERLYLGIIIIGR